LSLNGEPQVTPVGPQVEAQSRVGGVRSSRLRFNYPDPNFKLFWDAYPRRVGKASAYSKWLTVVREVEPQIVIEAAAQYAKENEGVEPQYLKYPEGWLSAGRWDDEVLPDGAERADQQAHDAITETERYLRDHGPIHD
jgi:hypothetical protein